MHRLLRVVLSPTSTFVAVVPRLAQPEQFFEWLAQLELKLAKCEETHGDGQVGDYLEADVAFVQLTAALLQAQYEG